MDLQKKNPASAWQRHRGIGNGGQANILENQTTESRQKTQGKFRTAVETGGASMMRASILAACFELARLAEAAMPETLAYLKRNGIRLTRAMSDCVGTITLAWITDHGNSLFDFDSFGFEAIVCDVMGEDGETAIDLIAWPVDTPETILSMFAVVALSERIRRSIPHLTLMAIQCRSTGHRLIFSEPVARVRRLPIRVLPHDKSLTFRGAFWRRAIGTVSNSRHLSRQIFGGAYLSLLTRGWRLEPSPKKRRLHTG